MQLVCMWQVSRVMIGNERTKLQVAHTKLSDSTAFVVPAYIVQQYEMPFDTHARSRNSVHLSDESS